MWDNRYRPLVAGEIIKEGDEVLTDTHIGWQRDSLCVGQAAPDPNYTSHRMYRRLKNEDAPHPTPEERYEAALSSAVQKALASKDDIMPSTKAAMITAIREAEAAGEAKSDDVLIRVLASLAAAISLLERMPKAKKAAPSDKVFEQMLIDYRNALEAGRTFIRARTDKENSDD